MSQIIQCPSCGKQLRVADEKLGGQGRCPGCKTIFQLPAAAPAMAENWLVHSHDGQQYGPVSKADLDGWVAEGLILPQCHLRRDSEADWRPAGEIYPQLLATEESQPASSGRWRISCTVGMLFTGLGFSNYQLLCGPDGIVVVPVSLADTLKVGVQIGAAAGMGGATAGAANASNVVKDNAGSDEPFELVDEGSDQWQRFPIDQLASVVVTRRGFVGSKVDLTAHGHPPASFKIDQAEATKRAR